MRDFTPLVGFGEQLVVPAGSTAYLILYPIPDFDVGDAEFLVEDDEEQGLFLERVVGEVECASATDGGFWAWSLLPLGVDYESLAVLEPYATDWSYEASNWANVKFWDRRRVEYGGGGVGYPSLVDHPFWGQVDIHPRMLLGSKRNLWPVWAVRNYGTAEARPRHFLRGFWK